MTLNNRFEGKQKNYIQ